MRAFATPEKLACDVAWPLLLPLSMLAGGWRTSIFEYEDEVRMKVVPPPRSPYATWTEPHRIVVRRDQVANEEVVKHELVHDSLGVFGHDSPLFGNCARAAP